MNEVDGGFCTVVAFDPGETTGWCRMTAHREWLTDVTTYDSLHYQITENNAALGFLETGQIDAKALGSVDAGIGIHRGHEALNLMGENEAVESMLELTMQKYPKSVVCLERFVLDPSKANSKYDLLSPVRIISAFSFGMHDAWLDSPERHPLDRIHLINRGDPKRTCTDERLKRWKLDPGGGNANGHARDATRIAYYFLRDCRGSGMSAREKRWRAWPHLFDDPMATVGIEAGRKAIRQLGERI